MATKTSPIGIIYSGIGGFSVALKMQQQLPHENLLYFGDGGNMPYGNHSAEEILTMTRYMLRFMEERGVKALLVACNTISCLIDRYRDDMTCPVLSVVEAGADAVSQMAVHKVGVISTCFTHSTRCYPDLIGKKAPDKEVVSHGCPDLAKLVEANVGDPAGQGILDADPTTPWWRRTSSGCIRDCPSLIRPTRWPRPSPAISRRTAWSTTSRARAPWTSTPPAVWRSTGRRLPRWASIR